jgi:cytochrome c
MKKIITAFFIAVILISCGNNDASKKEVAKGDDISKNPDYQTGLALVGKSNCFTCHAIEEKITGPAYRDVANKYASYPDTIISHLAGKVITGGSGVWGSIPMTPHPELSKTDAEAMVRYILLLKK